MPPFKQILRPYFFVLLILAVPAAPLWAQSAANTPATEGVAKEAAGGPGATGKKPKETWGVVPLVVPIFTPETRWMVAAGGIFWYNPWPEAPRERISEFTTFMTASQNEQFSFGLVAEAYFLEHRLRVVENLDLYDQPNQIWGIGPDTPQDAEEDYEPKGINNRTSFLWLVAPDLYIGGMWQSIVEHEDFKKQNGFFAGRAGARKAVVQGPGVHLIYDTRNSAFYPTGGNWFEVRGYQSAEVFGAGQNFAQFTFDARHYQTLWWQHVLALNAFATATIDDAPWQAYPRLGGQFQMRGYFFGRYIDRQLWGVQADYRLPVWWRFGFVVFGSIGNVTPSFGDLFAGGLKSAVGFGLRVMVDKDQKINMRLDAGFSNIGDINFYLSFKEAF